MEFALVRCSDMGDRDVLRRAADKEALQQEANSRNERLESLGCAGYAWYVVVPTKETK